MRGFREDNVSSLCSLRSSDSNENSGDGPVQLTQNTPKSTLLRRFSSATSSLFSTRSSPPNQTEIKNESEGFDHDIIGCSHIQQSLAPSSDDEHTIQDYSPSSDVHAFVPEELQPFSSYHPFTPQQILEGAVPERRQSETLLADSQVAGPPPLQRRRSTVVSAMQNLSQKFGFWDKEFLSQRNKIFFTLFHNYLFILVGFTIALCVYWGVYYDRPSRYKNIQFAVVLADTNDAGLQQVVRRFFSSPAVQAFGSFDIYDRSRISDLAQRHNISISAEVVRQVHHQHYQAAFYVHENASLALQTALQTANSSFSPATDLLSVYYETGSDYNAVSNYISTIVQQLCLGFYSAMASTPWTSGILQNVSEAQLAQLLALSPNLITQLPNFKVVDGIPVVQQVVQAPLQVGLIYLCIFTFFQFIFTLPIQMCVVAKLKGWRFLMFRILTSQSSYFVLSLSYVSLNSAFGIATNRTFGASGFLVVWALAFLTMSSVGSIIEILVLVCVVLKPAMIGVVLLMVAVANLAPTINPIYLCPTFYRYGYAMPVYNSYHLMQVAYFNSWKGHFGRHVGVLCAWIVVTNMMMPFAMKWVSRKMEEKRIANSKETNLKETNLKESNLKETDLKESNLKETDLKESNDSRSKDAPVKSVTGSCQDKILDQPVTTSAVSEAVTKGTEDLYREHQQGSEKTSS